MVVSTAFTVKAEFGAVYLTENMEEVIKLKDVFYNYGEDEEIVSALRGVSFSVKKGEFIALVGHNGSGKSTIAKLLNGLLVPVDGTVEVFGMDTADSASVMEIRRRVGMVFQNPDNQMVASIVEDDVAFGPENIGVPQPQIVERVEWALKSVGMYEFKDRTPHKLSGGQKQRIAIAGVLALRPDVIVLDESTAMLDPNGRAEVMKTVEGLRAKHGLTVISITHFMDEVIKADRVIVLNKGKIATEGTPEEVFANPQLLSECGLDVPRAIALADKLRAEGFDIPHSVLDAETLGEELCRLL